LKSKLVLLASCFLLAVAPAQSPRAEEPRKAQKPRALVYTLEGLGALGGIACCGLGGGGCIGLGYTAVGWAGIFAVLTGSGDSGLTEGASQTAWMVCGLCAVAMPAVTGYGAAAAGDRLGENGSRGWAIGGAYAGIPVAVGAVALGWNVSHPKSGWENPSWGIPFYVLGGLCIPAGAVVGYNLGKPRQAADSHQPDIGSRLEMPAVALTAVELPDRSVEYGVKVQLAGLRF